MRKNLLAKFAHGDSEFCLHNRITYKICSWQKKNWSQNRNCSQEKSCPLNLLPANKIAYDEKPCRLGWINTMAKCLASSQSEHGWRAPLYGLSRNGWNVLGPTFQFTAYVAMTNNLGRAANNGFLLHGLLLNFSKVIDSFDCAMLRMTFWKISCCTCTMSITCTSRVIV